jgi:hypothetical protein
MLPGGLRDSVDSGRGQKPGRLTIAPAAYDEIADWYEHEFLAATATPGTDPLGSLLGRGTGAPAWRSAAAPACTPAAYAAWAGLRSASTSPRRCCSAPATACPRPAPTPYDCRSATACLPAVIHRHGAHRHARLPRRADRGGPGSCSRAGASYTSASTRASAAGSPTGATPPP